jgi:hypothetical protein
MTNSISGTGNSGIEHRRSNEGHHRKGSSESPPELAAGYRISAGRII